MKSKMTVLRMFLLEFKNNEFSVSIIPFGVTIAKGKKSIKNTGENYFLSK